jgi:hypothetical protein
MKIAYNKELASREAIHQQWEKEHIEYQEALQIHVNELSTQLASVTAALEEVVAPWRFASANDSLRDRGTFSRQSHLAERATQGQA